MNTTGPRKARPDDKFQRSPPSSSSNRWRVTASPGKSRDETALAAKRIDHTRGEILSGRQAQAAEALGELERLSASRFVTSYGIALVHAGLGQNDAAFASLINAFDERSNWLVWLRLDPRWNGLRSDPRFTQLVSRMRFPP